MAADYRRPARTPRRPVYLRASIRAKERHPVALTILGLSGAVSHDPSAALYIDGKLIGFGYNAHVHVYQPELAGNRHFLDLLTLFTTSVGYHRAMRRSVKRRVRAVRSGEVSPHVVEDEEFWLLKNPRRRAA